MDNRAFTAPGELVPALEGTFHVRRWGDAGPLFVLECGLTLMSSCWGWIAPELATFGRVIAYDRAGLGWSSAREGLRDAGQLAAELAALIKSLGSEEEFFLVGHSMGAMVNRAFLAADARPVRAMVWLDPAHPEQVKRPGTRRRTRNLFFYLEAAQLLARKGVPAIEVPLARHLEGLPESDFKALRRFLRSPTHLRTSAREARAWGTAAATEADLLGVPVLMLSARKNALPGWIELQEELATLSSAGTTCKVFSEMSHISMLANQEHARKVAAEVRAFAGEIKGLA